MKEEEICLGGMGGPGLRGPRRRGDRGGFVDSCGLRGPRGRRRLVAW